MADETRIDPEGARRLFKNVEGVAHGLEEALQGVVNIRSTLSEPWGTDETGKRFSQAREPNAESSIGYVRDAITFVREFSDTGQKGIDEFQNTDKEHGGGIAPK